LSCDPFKIFTGCTLLTSSEKGPIVLARVLLRRLICFAPNT